MPKLIRRIDAVIVDVYVRYFRILDEFCLHLFFVLARRRLMACHLFCISYKAIKRNRYCDARDVRTYKTSAEFLCRNKCCPTSHTEISNNIAFFCGAFYYPFQKFSWFLCRVSDPVLGHRVFIRYIPPVVRDHTLFRVVDPPFSRIKSFTAYATLVISILEMRFYVTLGIWDANLLIVPVVAGGF